MFMLEWDKLIPEQVLVLGTCIPFPQWQWW